MVESTGLLIRRRKKFLPQVQILSSPFFIVGFHVQRHESPGWAQNRGLLSAFQIEMNWEAFHYFRRKIVIEFVGRNGLPTMLCESDLSTIDAANKKPFLLT